MKVELVTKTVGVNKYVDLNPDAIIEAVARHSKIKDNGGKLMRFLIRKAHWSPMEHVHYTFLVETKQKIAHQIIRHKSLHFQELSTRYEQIPGIEPIEFRLKHKSNRQSSTVPVGVIKQVGDSTFAIDVKDDCSSENLKAMRVMANGLELVMAGYQMAYESGIALETARDILPGASTTIMHITGNLRDLLAFLNIRCEESAQKDVRQIATMIGEELEKYHPSMEQLNWRNGMFMFSKD